MKPSPFWKTYAAVGVLGALGAYIYFVESKREVGPDGETTKKEKVFAFDKAKARALDLAPSGRDRVRVAKVKDAWRLPGPPDVAADAAEVESLLASLETLETETVVAEAPATLTQYGLAPARATVSVELEGAAAPLSLLLGDKTPDGSALYAKTAAAPRVFTVPAFAEASLLKQAFDLRDRSVLHVARDSVRGLEVRGPEGAYALALSPPGEWEIIAPLRTRASRWPVDGLVGTLESLRMEAVVAEAATDVVPFGLAPPVRTVTLVLADGTRRTLEIGAPAADPGAPPGGAASGIYARVAGSPLVAVIPGALSEDLAKGMDALRAKRLLDVATYEVEGFDVETPGAPKRTYARSRSLDAKPQDATEDGQTWKRTAPDAKDLAINTVQDALFQIGAVDVTGFLDAPSAPSAHGLDVPAARVTLRHEGGKPPVWFEIGSKNGDFFGRRSDDATVLALDRAKAEALLKALGGL